MRTGSNPRLYLVYAERIQKMIKFEHVSKVYSNGVKGLDNVNLQIEQGEFVAIIGLSGAGKSTLIRTINRMIDISDGRLEVDGIDVSSLKGKTLRRFRRKIGMIFQSFNLVTRTTVIKNVLTAKVPDMPFLRVLLGIYNKQERIQALEALDKVAVFTFAYVGKQLYELIETVDMGAYEAAEALGAGKPRCFINAIVPQVLPAYLSNCLFCFEGNVRYASILGYVGAGGLGLILNEKIGWREYSSVGMILIVLFLTVVVIEALSHYLRTKLT